MCGTCGGFSMRCLHRLNGADTGVWQLPHANAPATRLFHLWLPSGAHTLTLHAPTRVEVGTPRQISFALLGVQLGGC